MIVRLIGSPGLTGVALALLLIAVGRGKKKHREDDRTPDQPAADQGPDR